MDHGTNFEARATGPGTPRPDRTAFLTAIRPFAACLGLSMLLLGAAACGDDEDQPAPEELQAVEDVATSLFEASGAEVDYVLAHATDNIFETVFFTTPDDCASAPDECIGEPSSVQAVSGTEIDGDTATTTVVSDFGIFKVGLVRESGVWKGDSLQAGSDEVPDGAARVDLSLVDFAFGFDRAAIPANGNFAFHITNEGQQTHEVVVVSIAEGQDLEQAVGAVAEEVVPPVALKVFIRPGQQLDMAFEEPLPPGKYALVCFFPDTNDPEFAAHIDKGMFAEFTVQ